MPLIFGPLFRQRGARQLSNIATAIATWLGALSRSHDTQAHHRGGGDCGEVWRKAQRKGKCYPHTSKTHAPRKRCVCLSHRRTAAQAPPACAKYTEARQYQLYLPPTSALVGNVSSLGSYETRRLDVGTQWCERGKDAQAVGPPFGASQDPTQPNQPSSNGKQKSDAISSFQRWHRVPVNPHYTHLPKAAPCAICASASGPWSAAPQNGSAATDTLVRWSRA